MSEGHDVAAVSPGGHRRGIVLVLLAATLWSTSGLLVRIIEADEPTLIFWRSVAAAFALAGYALHAHRGAVLRVVLALGWPGLLVAALLAGDAILSVFALAHTRVANVMLIFSTTPLLAALLGWWWLGEPVSPRTWLATGACIAGVGVMVSGSLGTSLLLGDALAFVVVVLFASAVVAIRRFPHVNLLIAVWVSSMLSAASSLPFATPFGHSVQDYGLMGFFGAVEYALALLLFTAGARLVPAAQSTLIGLLEVVLSPIWVWLAIAEVPGRSTVMGGALILVTLVLYTGCDLTRGAGRKSGGTVG